jgi:hypothetical protein
LAINGSAKPAERIEVFEHKQLLGGIAEKETEKKIVFQW